MHACMELAHLCFRSILDGQHRIVMRDLASLLDVTDAVYGNGVMSSFKLQVLQYNSPPWALQLLSYQRSVQNGAYIYLSGFHTQLSLARKQLQVASLMQLPSKEKVDYVQENLEGTRKTRGMLARIACGYSEAALAELEYVY